MDFLLFESTGNLFKAKGF